MLKKLKAEEKKIKDRVNQRSRGKQDNSESEEEEEIEPFKHKSIVMWPKVEDVYDVFSQLDTSYMPSELQGWVESVRMLNEASADFDTIASAELKEEFGGKVQWLPSSTLVALRLLRPQDPVTLFEDQAVSFAGLFNFVRNWSDKFACKIDVLKRPGFQAIKNRFVLRYPSCQSKLHGKLANQRGLIFVDPDWNRGSLEVQTKLLIKEMHKFWRASTVIITYDMTPENEHKVRQWIKDVQAEGPQLDLLTAEMFVQNPEFTENEDQVKWRGCGALIVAPPFTTSERIRAAMAIICEEMAKVPGASEMHVRVEKVRPAVLKHNERRSRS